MGLREVLTGRSSEERSLEEQLRQAKWQGEFLAESVRQLEDAVSGDGEWRRLGAELEREFTRQGLDDIVNVSRAMYLAHPLIQRAVNITTYYTWGQGVEYSAEDDIKDQVVTPMLQDRANQTEYFGHQARLLTDVDQIVDGNVFLALFKTDPVSVRSIPSNEIRNIHCNPEDRAEVWFYYREWNADNLDLTSGRITGKVQKRYYPCIDYNPTTKIESIGGVEVAWDSPVIHQKVGGLKQMRFGVPGTYAALDWARAYKKFLEDWHTVVSSLARFAWTVTTKGSKVGAVQRKLNVRARGMGQGELGEGDSGERPNPAGQAWVGVEGDKLTPVPKTGAHISSEDARPSRLMVGAAMDLPDTILSGDADVGNLATAKTLDRPTELAMRSRQSMWQDFDERIFAFAVRVAEEQGKTFATPQEKRKVKVTFPPILEHDSETTVRAIVTAATLDGKTDAGILPREELARQLMSAIGVEDVAAAIADLQTEDRAAVAGAVERLREAIADE